MNTYLKEDQEKHPFRTLQDDIKFLHQAYLGCGHFVEDEKKSYERLKEEAIGRHGFKEEVLSDHYSRIYFGSMSDKELYVFNRLFYLSSRLNLSNMDAFKEDLIKRHLQIPDSLPVSHSHLFKKHYDPHYRVMYRHYWSYFDLLVKIEKGVIGIDGRCGSGKSTLGTLISLVYQCPLIHMDDFYLPQHLRTKQRYDTPGANVHYERVVEEVKKPILNKENLHIGIFSHDVMDVKYYEDIPYHDLIVIEGTYCFHPTLRDLFTLKIFSHINKEQQEKRIIKRNGEEIYQMFKDKWIPLEELYFNNEDIMGLADIVIDSSYFDEKKYIKYMKL